MTHDTNSEEKISTLINWTEVTQISAIKDFAILLFCRILAILQKTTLLFCRLLAILQKTTLLFCRLLAIYAEDDIALL